MKQVFREALYEHHELVGMPIETPDDRTKLREDALWLRTMRLRFDRIASRIGYAVLTAIIGGLLAVFVAGFKIKIGQ